MSVRRRRSILGGAAGNLVEWYDWYVYSAFSLYFAKSFFPERDLTAQLLRTSGIFALGFLMRPVGSWLMGRLADRHGRRTALAASVGLMCCGSLLIALDPGLRHDRRRRARAALARPRDPGHQHRRRIRRRRHLPQRDGSARPARVLVELPIVVAALLCLTGGSSTAAVTKSELFPAHVRAIGVGLPYAISASIFGGSAEYVALWFKAEGFERGYFWYASAMIALSLIAFVLMPETRWRSAMDEGGR